MSLNGWKIARQRRRPERAAKRAYVSLNRRGEIAMNLEAFGRIREPATVVLLYDERRRRIGVKFPIGADGEFFPVRRYGREGRLRVVRAARLLKQFGIQIDRTLIFRDAPVEDLNGHPLLVLQLNQEEP